MGYVVRLPVGSATATIVPAHWQGLTDAAWHMDTVTWLVGTAIGMITALGFAMRLVGRSTAAAQAIAARATYMLLPYYAHSAQGVANAYGWFMLVAGIPLAGWASARRCSRTEPGSAHSWGWALSARSCSWAP